MRLTRGAAPPSIARTEAPAARPRPAPMPAPAVRARRRRRAALPRVVGSRARPAAQPVEKPTAPPQPARKRKDAGALAPGLARTRSTGFIAGLGALFAGRKELDPSIFEGIEKILLSADIGVRTSQMLLEEIRTSLSRKELANPDAIWAFLRRRSAELLAQDHVALIDFGAAKPVRAALRSASTAAARRRRSASSPPSSSPRARR